MSGQAFPLVSCTTSSNHPAQADPVRAGSAGGPTPGSDGSGPPRRVLRSHSSTDTESLALDQRGRAVVVPSAPGDPRDSLFFLDEHDDSVAAGHAASTPVHGPLGPPHDSPLPGAPTSGPWSRVETPLGAGGSFTFRPDGSALPHQRRLFASEGHIDPSARPAPWWKARDRLRRIAQGVPVEDISFSDGDTDCDLDGSHDQAEIRRAQETFRALVQRQTADRRRGVLRQEDENAGGGETRACGDRAEKDPADDAHLRSDDDLLGGIARALERNDDGLVRGDQPDDAHDRSSGSASLVDEADDEADDGSDEAGDQSDGASNHLEEADDDSDGTSNHPNDADEHSDDEMPEKAKPSYRLPEFDGTIGKAEAYFREIELAQKLCGFNDDDKRDFAIAGLKGDTRHWVDAQPPEARNSYALVKGIVLGAFKDPRKDWQKAQAAMGRKRKAGQSVTEFASTLMALKTDGVEDKILLAAFIQGVGEPIRSKLMERDTLDTMQKAVEVAVRLESVASDSGPAAEACALGQAAPTPRDDTAAAMLALSDKMTDLQSSFTAAATKQQEATLAAVSAVTRNAPRPFYGRTSKPGFCTLHGECLHTTDVCRVLRYGQQWQQMAPQRQPLSPFQDTRAQQLPTQSPYYQRDPPRQQYQAQGQASYHQQPQQQHLYQQTPRHRPPRGRGRARGMANRALFPDDSERPGNYRAGLSSGPAN